MYSSNFMVKRLYSDSLLLVNSETHIPETCSCVLNERMKTAEEIRHQNLLKLIDEAGSITKLAEIVGKPHAQISQLKNRAKDSKTGTPKDIGGKQARYLESAMGKERGWMDHDHAEIIETPADLVEKFAFVYAHADAQKKMLLKATLLLVEEQIVSKSIRPQEPSF